MTITNKYITEVRNVVKEVDTLKTDLGRLINSLSCEDKSSRKMGLIERISKLDMNDMTSKLDMLYVFELGKYLGGLLENDECIHGTKKILDEYFAKLESEHLNTISSLYDTGGIANWTDNLIIAVIRLSCNAGIPLNAIKFKADMHGKTQYGISIIYSDMTPSRVHWLFSNINDTIYDLIDVPEFKNMIVHEGGRNSVDHGMFMRIIHKATEDRINLKWLYIIIVEEEKDNPI